NGCAWTATTTNFWVHVSSNTTNGVSNGSGTVIYFVDANGSSSSRNGAIRIDGQNFLISQGGASNGPPACTYAISPSNAVYSAGGGTGLVSVTTQEGCVWTATTSNGWLHVTSSTTNFG